MLETVLFDVRMAFLELTNMISMQAMQPPPPPPPGKDKGPGTGDQGTEGLSANCSASAVAWTPGPRALPTD